MQRMFLISLIFLLTLHFSCTEKPTSPEDNNPFDPLNTQTSGDPFQLEAIIANGGITLSWAKPGMAGIAQFKIYRSEQQSTDFTDYTELEMVGASVWEYVDRTVQNGHSYWYRVSAVDHKGNETQMTNTVAVNVKTEPVIIINGGDAFTPTINVNLTIRAATATQMMISNHADFDDGSWENYNTGKDWSIIAGEGIRTVYLKVKYDNTVESAAVSSPIILDQTPPSITLMVTPDSGITNETEFQFDPAGSSDNLAPMEDLKYRLDYENDGNFDTDWTDLSILRHTYGTGGGDKEVTMELRDVAGWTADTSLAIFVNTRPVASFTATENSTNPLLYHFDSSASSDYEDGSALEYRWDFDGDGTWDTDYTATPQAEHEYTVIRDYIPRLSVRDRDRLTAESDKSITLFIGTVTDIDGNVYQGVKIGNHWWMAENLKVTHYRNGDIIPGVTDGTEWLTLTNGACSAYDNMSSNTDTYGLLYNWFAVSDSRNIAPEGWHVATDAEWKELEMYLGMSQSEANGTGWRGSEEGGKLKEAGTVHWTSPNTGATNETGFTALPGGQRSDYDGKFNYLTTSAYFWTSTEYNTVNAWSRELNCYLSDTGRYSYSKQNGFSVRCVKDSN